MAHTIRTAAEHLTFLEDRLRQLERDGGDLYEIARIERVVSGYRANGIQRVGEES
jgi:hypothetical protein